MQVDLTYVFGFIAILSTVTTILSVMKKDNKTDGITQGKLSNDLEYVKRGVDNIALDQKDSAREQAKLRQDLIINQNETAKALENAERAYKHADKAHSRINKLGGIANEQN